MSAADAGSTGHIPLAALPIDVVARRQGQALLRVLYPAIEGWHRTFLEFFGAELFGLRGNVARRDWSLGARIVVGEEFPFQQDVACRFAIRADDDLCAAGDFVHAIGTHQFAGNLHIVRMGGFEFGVGFFFGVQYPARAEQEDSAGEDEAYSHSRDTRVSFMTKLLSEGGFSWLQVDGWQDFERN